ncbi:MAG: Hsp70 family protein [Chloroflexales bacterium]|nr:Hsp70 family protein [Chloroflexales bacterium]
MLIGIDIGTHAARAAALDHAGRPFLIPDAYGATHMPAVVRYGLRGLEVGEGPARTLVAGWECSVRGPARYLARFADLPEAAHRHAAFPILDADGEPRLDLLYARVAPEEALGAIIAALCGRAAAHLGAPPTEAVLAVPASAEERYRVLVRRAAEAQGLRVRRLINQPSAALLAYIPAVADAEREDTAERPVQTLVAVVDVGGGTTDVSIAELGAGMVRILATAGDPFLGGHDLAWLAATNLAERLRPQAGRDLMVDQGSKVATLGLLHAAEAALEDLALLPAATVALDHGAGFGRDLYTVVRREQTEAWLAPGLERIAALCRRALELSGRPADAISEVLLIGGASGLPGVRLAVARALGRLPGDLRRPAPQALAAYGAALAGTVAGAALRDVTTYPLGINCYFGDSELLSPIIPAGTPIPTPPAGAPGARTEHYTTRHPDQTSVRLDVLQYRGPKTPATAGPGRVRPHECEVLGSWEFSGLRPPAGRHAPFTVTFQVDEDGILHLAAEEQGTGHRLEGAVRRL